MSTKADCKPAAINRAMRGIHHLRFRKRRVRRKRAAAAASCRFASWGFMRSEIYEPARHKYHVAGLQFQIKLELPLFQHARDIDLIHAPTLSQHHRFTRYLDVMLVRKI